MTKMTSRARGGGNAKRRSGSGRATVGLDDAKLRALIQETTADAHDEEEATMVFFDVVQDELALPFKTEVLGVEVVVEGIGMIGDVEIVGICKRGSAKQKIPLDELPLPDPPPTGAQWIEAYRRWRELG